MLLRNLAFLAVAFLMAGSPARAEESPAQFVQALGDTALNSLTDKSLPRAEREQRVRQLLNANFDIPTIGRFALGPHWREASESQRQEYLALFENSLVGAYTNRFEDYAGQTLRVSGFTPDGEKDAIVASQVLQQDGPAVSVQWRVRNEAGTLKVVDVLVEGISMSITQRSEFVSIVQRGGNVQALIALLREKSGTQVVSINPEAARPSAAY